MLRNVILGWSGVLADDVRPAAAATDSTRLHHAKSVRQREGVEERTKAEMDRSFEPHLPPNPSAVALLPHALEFLGFCFSTRRRVFLVSSISPALFAEQSGPLGLVHFFERAYVGTTDQREQLARILREHQLMPSESALIGERIEDVESARLLGVMSIAISTGSVPFEQLSRAQPDVIIRDLRTLQTLMEQITAPDEILVEDLEFFARLGVPAEERAKPQRLLATLRLVPRHHFRDMANELARTVDYAAVCAEIESFARDRSDHLLENFADALASHLLAQFALARLELELRKFVLPQTKYVAVRVVRVSPNE
jgi:dihydroneopterin aldolase